MISYAVMLNLLLAQSPEWVYQYENPDFSEVPYAMAIDESMNSYVTGYIGLVADGGIGIIKLNTNGTEKWIYWKDPLNSGGYGYDIINKENLLFITGYVQSTSEMRCITIKIDTIGHEKWLLIDTMAHGRGAALAIDSLGGIYSAGMIYGQATDIRVIKYDTLGNVCWRYIYDGPAASYDESADIVADRWNNVYVGGYSTGIGTYSDYTIIKLDSAGNERWVYRYDGLLHTRDEITALAVDTLGNVYACGSSGGDDWDICVVSVDSTGRERWVYRLDGLAPEGGDYGNDLVLDSIGQVYVGGVIRDDSIGMFAVVKLDTAGRELWCYKSHGPVGFDGGIAWKITTDASGGIYAAGSFRNYERHGQIAAVKLTAAGDTVWTYIYPHQPVSPYSDVTRDLAIDALGNAYLTGGIRVSQWDQDIVVMKFAGGVGINEAQAGAPVHDPRLPAVCRNGLRVSGRAAAGLSVYDVTGRPVLRPGGRGGFIHLTAGVYFAFHNEGGATFKQKIVVVE